MYTRLLHALNSKIIQTSTRGGIDGCSIKQIHVTPSLFRDYKNAEHDRVWNRFRYGETQKLPRKKTLSLCIHITCQNGIIELVSLMVKEMVSEFTLMSQKALWNEKLKNNGYNPTIVDHPHFIVGHFFLNKNANIYVNLKNHIRTQLNNESFTIIFESDDVINSDALRSTW